ncbi:hypothetical protein BLAT2472_20120 [Burkholderia latens]
MRRLRRHLPSPLPCARSRQDIARVTGVDRAVGSRYASAAAPHALRVTPGIFTPNCIGHVASTHCDPRRVTANDNQESFECSHRRAKASGMLRPAEAQRERVGGEDIGITDDRADRRACNRF